MTMKRLCKLISDYMGVLVLLDSGCRGGGDVAEHFYSRYLSYILTLYQPTSAHLPETLLSGINVAHGIVGSIKLMTEEPDVEFL